MSDEYSREIRRILRNTEMPIAQSVADIAADLKQIKAEAEAGGHHGLAQLIEAAFREAIKLKASDAAGP